MAEEPNDRSKLDKIDAPALEILANDQIQESEPMFPSTDVRKRKSDEMIIPITPNYASSNGRRKSPRFQNVPVDAASTKKIQTRANNSLRKSQRLCNNGKENHCENPIKNHIIDTSECDSIGLLSSSTKTDPMNASHILSVTANDLVTTTQSANLSRIQVVNISGDETLFEKFSIQMRLACRIGFSMAVGKTGNDQQPPSRIGANLLINQFVDNRSEDACNCAFDNGLWHLAGIAFCLDDDAAEVIFYMNFQNDQVPLDRCIKLLDELFGRHDVTLKMYDARDQSKIMMQAIPQLRRIACQLEDPRIANWLLHPDEGEANLLNMVCRQNYKN